MSEIGKSLNCLRIFAVTAVAAVPGQGYSQGFSNVSYSADEVGQPIIMFERTRLIENEPGTEDDVVRVGGGRQAIIAFQGDSTDGYLYTVPEVPDSQTGSHLQARLWDLSDLSPAAIGAQEFFSVNDPGNLGLTTSYSGVGAHGYAKRGTDVLLMGASAIRLQAGGSVAGVVDASPSGLPMFSRGDLFHPWYMDTYWSYSAVEGLTTLSLEGVQLAEWDHLGDTGVVGHPFLIGNILYMASDQSRTGVAAYDISVPSNPQLLDVLTLGGPGGYWPEVWGGDGSLYLVFPFRTGGNGFRVVDITDPNDMRFVTQRDLPGDECMYAQFQDQFAFIGQHKIDMQTFESVLQFDTSGTSDAHNAQIDTSQFALPIGNLVVTGGSGPGQGVAIFPHQEAPDSEGPRVGFHRPLAGHADYPTQLPITILIHETLDTRTITEANLVIQVVGGAAVPHSDLTINFTFNDILQIHPDNGWDAGTTYDVTIVDGGIRDVAGNGIDGYNFSFSTPGAGMSPNLPPAITQFAPTSSSLPGDQVDFTVAASDPDAAAGDGLQYRFQSGTAEVWTTWSDLPTFSHIYPDAGHFTAKVQVREVRTGGMIGALATRVVRVTVTSVDPGDPQPVSSSPIVCDDVNRRLWIVNPDNDTLTLRDIDTGVQQEIAVGGGPRNVAVDASGNAWVTCHDDHHVEVIAPDGTVSSPAALNLGYGSAPFGVVMSPDGATAYISTSGSGELRRFDTATRSEIGAALPLGPTARAMVIDAAGSRLFVSRFISAQNFGEIWEIDLGTFTLSRSLRLPRFSGEAGFFDSTASGQGVPNYVAGLALGPDPDGAGPAGERLLAASKLDNTNRGTLTSPFNDLTQDNTVRTVVSRLDLNSGTLIGATDIDNSDSATSITFSPLSDYFFVTLQGTNDIVIIDNLAVESESGFGGFVTRLPAGLAPQGACFDRQTNQLFSKNFMDRSVTSFDLSGLLATGSIAVSPTTFSTVGVEQLPTNVLTGKQIFYNSGDTRMSAEGYISCATCHVDGGSDKRVWDFTGRDEGLRKTIDLRGRSGVGHGNVHWSGNFDEIQDFEHDIRGAFGGSGFIEDSLFETADTPLGDAKAGMSTDLDALAAYVASLGSDTIPPSPHRENNGSVSATGVAGQAVFEAMNCAACHSGPELTNSNAPEAFLFDVGTLTTSSGERLNHLLPGIDVPTLRGLWDNAPYLHDGSAATLDDVFRMTGGLVYQAESGVVAGAQSPAYTWDNSMRGGGWVLFEALEQTLTLTGIDGGFWGSGGHQSPLQRPGAPDRCLSEDQHQRDRIRTGSANDRQPCTGLPACELG